MSKKFEQAFHKIEYSDSQPSIETVLILTSNLENINQTAMRTHCTSIRMAKIRKALLE